MNAKNKPIGRDEAAAILAKASRIYVAKGKNVLEFDMKRANMDDVLAVALGPTGNLRAPTLRSGKTLMIGFSEETYKAALGK